MFLAPRTHLVKVATAAAMAIALAGCPGGGGGGGDDGSGEIKVIGSLKGTTSDIKENSGWSVVFTERESGICRVATIGPSGKYEVKNLRTGVPMTIVLLDTTFRLRSVLSFPGLEVGQIRQYFTFSGTTLPSLIQQGGIIKFSDTTGINIEKTWASDKEGTAGDGVPDGMDTTPKDTTTTLVDNDPDDRLRRAEFRAAIKARRRGEFQLVDKSKVFADTDGDLVENSKDPDIDGDGIPNRFDADIDGDDIQNVFSADANGDLVEDILETSTESNFQDYIEYFVVQVIQAPDSTKTMQTYLNFTVKLRSLGPDVISIRGSSKLLKDSQTVFVDTASGIETLKAWDFTLADDGLNGDSEAKDLIYSRKVLLKKDVTPGPGEVIFAKLQYGTQSDTARYIDFPYVFPRITTRAFTPSLSDSTFTLTLTDKPFLEAGSTDQVNLYAWSVELFDETVKPRQKVFASDPVNLTDTPDDTTSVTYKLPGDSIHAGSYVAYVVLQPLGMRIPGLPQWSLLSSGLAITIK